MNIRHFALVVLLAAAALTPARAAHFLFQYDSDPQQSQIGGPATATLFLTTSNTLNALGSYDIVSASGTVDGAAVTGLVVNPNQPNYGHFGSFSFDNVIDVSSYFSDYGILVTTAGLTYNFGYSGGYYAISTDGSTHVNNHGQTVFVTKTSFGAGSLTAVPEPASWMTMLAGFGLAGLVLRRHRTTITYA